MKIGIITHWWCFENYGQLLQCFAFQKFLRSRGHDPFLIKYYPGSEFADRLTWGRVLRKLRRFPQLLLSIWNRISGRTRKMFSRRADMSSMRDFDGFRAKYIKSTKGVYRSYSELVKSNEIDADMYSVGSDVVWLMLPCNNDGRVMFCDFGRSDAKRISYSASFGTATLSPEKRRFIAPLLKNLSLIGVREKSAVRLCKEMGRSDARHVMDPVFLLPGKMWRGLFEIPDKRSGVFIYYLRSDFPFPLSFARKMAETLRCGISAATVYSDMDFPREWLVNPTIPEWVRTVGSSSFVFTNSFHCTALCILLHTPFMVLLKHGGKGMDERLLSLLDSVSLQNRIIDNCISDEMATCEIDWASVDSKVDTMLKNSLDFLAEAGI